MPADVTGVPDAVRSLEWTAAIERTTRLLPSSRGIARLRRRDFLHNNRIAFSAQLDAAAAFPARGLFVDQRTGASVLVAGNRPRVRSTAAADVVMAGVMRTREQLRFRSFYVTRTGRTLVVQQRHRASVPTPLVAGSAVQRTLPGRTPFVVPELLDSGLARRGLSGDAVADWVVEEALDGAPVVRPAEAEATVLEVLELLAEMWKRLGVAHAPLGEKRASTALAAFTRLAEERPDGCWPGGLDPQRTRERVETLLAEGRPLTVGLSHGDPGLGNVLRLVDGRLALVDWEDAGHRPVAHDVVKVLMSAPDPLGLVSALDAPPTLRPALAAAGAVPWRSQIATAMLLFLGGWRNRHQRAVKRGAVNASVRRLDTMLRMLDGLLP